MLSRLLLAFIITLGFNVSSFGISISTGKTMLCNGDSTTIVSTGCVGQVNWNNGQQGVEITVKAASYYRATCQLDGTSSSLLQIFSSITPNPPFIASNKTIMCNETASLVIIGCYETISWSNGENKAINVVSESGTYYATCINTCGPSDTSNNIVLRKFEIPTSPSITASQKTICNNQSIILEANCLNNTTVFWNNGQKTKSRTIYTPNTYSASCTNECGQSPESDIIIAASSNPSHCLPIRVQKL